MSALNGMNGSVADGTGTRIRVILADDHPVVRDGLATIVNQQKDMMVVAEAADGEAAITLFEEHRPDVMVPDLRMPRRDGVSVGTTPRVLPHAGESVPGYARGHCEGAPLLHRLSGAYGGRRRQLAKFHAADRSGRQRHGGVL